MSRCVHFGACGGCRLQDLPPDAYRAHKREAVVAALKRVGLGDAGLAETLLVPEKSRRRAVFKFGKKQGQVAAGFHGAKSHQIVDMHECQVLRPALLRLAGQLRTALAPVLAEGEKGEVHVTETENGLDLAFRWQRKLNAALTAQISRSFQGQNIARIIFNGEILLEQAPAMVQVGPVAVTPPSHGFLQATREGEEALQARVLALTRGARKIADLFAGIGTFALPLARNAKVHAVEEDQEALAALAEAARKASGLKPLTTEKRDLFKTPLTALELNAFDAVVLDPPRAGAEAQVKVLTASKIRRIAYVSCDASTFARDAAILVKTGFTLGEVLPVDQFLYSDHIELVAGFSRS
jgi:23S rRNA (uracil1939-C5)-methyltransferase